MTPIASSIEIAHSTAAPQPPSPAMDAPSVAMSAAGIVIAMAKPSNHRIRLGRCSAWAAAVICSVDMRDSIDSGAAMLSPSRCANSDSDFFVSARYWHPSCSKRN
ncbi:hypothetical protein ACFPRL_18435 [Pseudoclavibacter helvolus]